MIKSFIDNVTLGVIGVAGAATIVFIGVVVVAATIAFFTKLKDEGSPLKAWIVGIAIAVIILAGVKTWYFHK